MGCQSLPKISSMLYLLPCVVLVSSSTLHHPGLWHKQWWGLLNGLAAFTRADDDDEVLLSVLGCQLTY